jgi:hypothetical protein
MLRVVPGSIPGETLLLLVVVEFWVWVARGMEVWSGVWGFWLSIGCFGSTNDIKGTHPIIYISFDTDNSHSNNKQDHIQFC